LLIMGEEEVCDMLVCCNMDRDRYSKRIVVKFELLVSSSL
jgi:hypothetical protein